MRGSFVTDFRPGKEFKGKRRKVREGENEGKGRKKENERKRKKGCRRKIKVKTRKGRKGKQIIGGVVESPWRLNLQAIAV